MRSILTKFILRDRRPAAGFLPGPAGAAALALADRRSAASRSDPALCRRPRAGYAANQTAREIATLWNLLLTHLKMTCEDCGGERATRLRFLSVKTQGHNQKVDFLSCYSSFGCY